MVPTELYERMEAARARASLPWTETTTSPAPAAGKFDRPTTTSVPLVTMPREGERERSTAAGSVEAGTHREESQLLAAVGEERMLHTRTQRIRT